MLSFEVRNVEIKHTYTMLEARSIGEVVDIRITEFDNESQITLNANEAAELFELLKNFLGEK